MATPEHQYLAFGIPSLDRLLGTREGDPSGGSRPGLNLTPQARDADDPGRGSAPGAADGLIDASVCIIGPDGTGKSIFALHLASEHWRKCAEWRAALPKADDHVAPKIIYASSDLSLSMARTMWTSFWLGRPFSRRGRIPFESGLRADRGPGWLRPEDTTPNPREAVELNDRDVIRLKRYRPSGKQELARFLQSDGHLRLTKKDKPTDGDKEIAFIDLESDTSGDDWSFLNKMLHALPQPNPGDPLHLLVIDAIEGLETLVGRRDAFGEEQDRRARVANLVRAAAGKCHLVLVVEEPKRDERLPEVFVADVVVRLRATMDGDYSRRTVEVEKVRGQKHTRGQHDFRMRGASSDRPPDDAEAYPIDTPAVGWRRSKDEFEFMSYVLVFPSLHQVARERGPAPADAGGRRNGPFAMFGIYHLDTMLGSPAHPWSGRAPDPGADERGLPAGSVTTVIGREATHKSQLARSFLAMAFRTRYESADSPARSKVNLGDPLLGQGVAVLLTTAHLGHDRVRRLIKGHLIPETYASAAAETPRSTERAGPSHDDGLDERLIVRYLEPHHLTAAILLHTVQQLITEAKRRLEQSRADWVRRAWGRLPSPWGLVARPPLGGGERDSELGERIAGLPSSPWAFVARSPLASPLADYRVRFVIDDWAILLSTFPEVRDNPKFLPALIRYLKAEGVSTLILANHQGNPTEELKDGLDPHFQELRSHSDHCLHTWQVSFFDERRVAITLLPQPQPGVSQQVRELRPARLSEMRGLRHPLRATDLPPGFHPLLRRAEEQRLYHDEHLTVDPHFELYSGLERGTPGFIPLRVYLYAEKEDIPAFQGYLSEIKNLFAQVFGHREPQTVLSPQYGVTYDALREYSYLQSETRLDHTLVLQVDEFWAESRSELLRLEEYLNARTVDYDDRPVLGEDPFGLFQLSDDTKRRRAVRELFLRDPERAPGPPNERRAFHGPLRRRDFFDPTGYSVEQTQQRYPVMKIPYTWDFGFLICDAIAWEKHEDVLDHRTERVVQSTGNNLKVYGSHLTPADRDRARNQGSFCQPTRIAEIWDRVLKIEVPHDLTEAQKKKRSVEYEKDVHGGVAEKLFAPSSRPVTGPGAPAAHGAATGASPPPAEKPSLPDRPKAFQLQVLRRTPAPVKEPNNQNPIDEPLYTTSHVFGVPRQKEEVMTAAGAKDPAANAAPTGDAEPARNPVEPLTWREFLGACATIARESNYKQLPFDIDMMAVESLSCLVFEVWMSELYESVEKVAKTKLALYTGDTPGDPLPPGTEVITAEEWKELRELVDAMTDGNRTTNRYWPRYERDEWTAHCLSRLLDTHVTDPDPDKQKTNRAIAAVFRRALYRTFVLLGEVINIDQLSDPNLNLKPRVSSPQAVASRHWYSTATASMAATDCRGRVVAGLPGNFSARGDWFLAIARGSRSPRLGERAIDILCSKRGNVTRLQHGLGLPVRDLQGYIPDGQPGAPPHEQHRIEYWTSLPYAENNGTRHNIHYRELRALGASDWHPGTEPRDGSASQTPPGAVPPRDKSYADRIGRQDFHWFWRSSLESYDGQSRIWQRWLCHVMRHWRTEWRPRPAAPRPARPQEQKKYPEYVIDLVPEAERGQPWWDGFREYDHYRRVEMHPATTRCCYVDEATDRHTRFDRMVDGLIETLGRANLQQSDWESGS